MHHAESRTDIHLLQPGWLKDWLGRPAPTDDRGRLEEVLALAGTNIIRAGGGPFAAAVYDLDSGRRLSMAVNTVVSNQCAAAHAELQALSLAQQVIGNHTLAGKSCVLVSSSAPCTMCLGAIAWSGVQALVFSSTRQDVEKIGFDEGPKTPSWRRELEKRGIAVLGPLLRRQGQQVLTLYQEQGGVIYNGPETPHH
ncbi:MAG: nucleoside deaminase [Gammaproteobacteria bacterium HGW-Gammaproteobacteria-14]|nr:MAG: nucleoside deaminase [Gammaproteobacteria bacterium HGW-Gammaproteobacteria-14]